MQAIHKQKSTLSVSKYAVNKHDSILVLLHGWGSSSKIWQPLIEQLAKSYEVWCIDLPGHGDNETVVWDASVEQGMQLFAEALPPKCSVIGWSLGGLCAQLFMQQYPERIEKLMLIASTVKFVAGENWLHGMEKNKFDQFCASFAKAPQKTLLQFNALQIIHSSDAKKVMQTLSDATVHQNLQSLAWGLRWLEEIDLRDMKIPKHCEFSLLQGESDQVCSVRAAEDMQNLFSGIKLAKLAQAGHVPFLADPDWFLEQVRNW